MTTILSFPVELLAEIFHIAVQWQPGSCPSPEAVLEISQVCRHWRTICLETPRFWSGIVVYGCNACNRYAKIFLERCKGTPIDLYADPHKHRINHAIFPLSFNTESYVRSLISPHTDQIRSITILRKCPLLEFVISLKHPLPLLRSVRMNADGPRRFWNLPVRDQAVAIHTLDLVGIAIRLDLPVFCDMVHLNINLALIQDPRTIEIVLAILASSPRMRVLRLLYFILPTSQQLLPPPSQIIRLEHLEQLDLRARVYDVAYLFSHLSIPLTTVIKININISLERSYLPFLFFPESILTKFLSASSFLFISFELSNIQKYEFQGVELYCIAGVVSASAPLLKWLHDIFDLVPPPSPLSDVRLCLNGISVTDHEWVGIITRPTICNVRSLLAYSNNHSFFVALASRKPPETPYLPNLETLDLSLLPSEVNVVDEYIQNYLEARIGAGIRLKELRVPEWFTELPESTVLLSLVDSFVTVG